MLEVTDEQCKRAAMLKFYGATENAISTEMQVSPALVRRILRDDRFAVAHKDILAKVNEVAQDIVRQNLVELTGMAVSRLREALKAGSREGMEGIKVVLKVAGVLDQDNTKTGDSSVTVILPSTTESKETFVIDNKEE